MLTKSELRTFYYKGNDIKTRYKFGDEGRKGEGDKGPKGRSGKLEKNSFDNIPQNILDSSKTALIIETRECFTLLLKIAGSTEDQIEKFSSFPKFIKQDSTLVQNSLKLENLQVAQQKGLNDESFISGTSRLSASDIEEQIMRLLHFGQLLENEERREMLENKLLEAFEITID